MGWGIRPQFGRFLSKTAAAAIASAQTGAMVITNGLIVSLFECDTLSKASNTATEP